MYLKGHLGTFPCTVAPVQSTDSPTNVRGARVEPLIVFVPGYHAKQPRRRNTTAARHAGEAAMDSHRQVHRIASRSDAR